MYTISAILYDFSKQPVPFASVQEVSVLGIPTGKGVDTGEDGRFTLKVSSKDSLIQTSKLGYETFVVSAYQYGKEQFMAEYTQDLDEVVITIPPKPKAKPDNSWLLWVIGAAAVIAVFTRGGKDQVKPTKVTL